MDTNTIEKIIVLKASHERVWQAISSAERFGAWFGAAFDGPFVVGSWLNCRIVPTTADAEVAKLQEPYKGARFRLLIECIEPMHRLSFRWHPFAVDPGRDYSSEPTTLVTFALSVVPDGIQLRITESGFDHIPLFRRAQAFEANQGGWAHQARLIEKYLAQERMA